MRRLLARLFPRRPKPCRSGALRTAGMVALSAVAWLLALALAPIYLPLAVARDWIRAGQR